MFILKGIFLFQIQLIQLMQNLWNLSLFFYHVTVEMEKNPATFLSLFTCNALTFLITLYQPFSNLHWHFPYCNYLAVTQINIKIGYKKQKCVQKRTIFNWKNTQLSYVLQPKHMAIALREKCPNTELFLVCIFLYSD